MAVERKQLKVRKYGCMHCGKTSEAMRWNYEPWNHDKDGIPECCGEKMAEIDGRPLDTLMIETDDIPGGLLVEHALCDDDGTPPRSTDDEARLRDLRRDHHCLRTAKVVLEPAHLRICQKR